MPPLVLPVSGAAAPIQAPPGIPAPPIQQEQAGGSSSSSAPPTAPSWSAEMRLLMAVAKKITKMTPESLEKILEEEDLNEQP